MRGERLSCLATDDRQCQRVDEDERRIENLVCSTVDRDLFGRRAWNAAQPLTSAQKSFVTTTTDKANKDETLQWVFVGVGGAFAVAGGYLLYKGYLAAGGEHGEGQSASNHGLRIFPTATASVRGIAAEFDF